MTGPAPDQPQHSIGRTAALPGDLLEPVLRSASDAVAAGTAPLVEAWAALIVTQIAASPLTELAPLVRDERLVVQLSDQIDRVVKTPNRFQQVAKRAAKRLGQAETAARLALERERLAPWQLRS